MKTHKSICWVENSTNFLCD